MGCKPGLGDAKGDLWVEREAEELSTEQVGDCFRASYLIERMGEGLWEEMTEQQRNFSNDV